MHQLAVMEHGHDGEQIPSLVSQAVSGIDGDTLALAHRDNVAPRMAVDVSVVRDIAALRGIEEEWRALASRGTAGLFRGPDWLIPWWQAYHATLHA